MKRILSLILTLCVMLSCVSISPVVYAENNSEKWKIGENITWTFENNVLTISGTGDMYDFEYDNRLWLNEDEYYSDMQVKKIIVSEGITSIGSRVFENCMGIVDPDNDNYRLPLELVVPATVSSIGNQGYTGITKFTISDNNSYYSSADGILYNKDKTTLVFYPWLIFNKYYVVPSTVERIENNAFIQQEAMRAIYIPRSVKYIGDNQIYCKRVYYECSEQEYKTMQIAGDYYAPDHWNCFYPTAYDTVSKFNASVSDMYNEYKEPEKITGKFKFVPTTNINNEYKKTVNQISVSEDFSYDDTYFDGYSEEYNHNLARTSIRLAMSAFGKQYVENGKIQYDRQYENVEDFMSKMKFTNISHNANYEKQPTENSIGVAVGMKKISYDDNGDCVLLAVAIRGGCYESEWAGNFNVGNGNVHAGFNQAANQVVDYLKNYIIANNLTKEDIKIWITGYSRAAATANISAQKIIDGGLGDSIPIYSGDVFAYCFETPSGVMNPDNDWQYNNIFNIVNQHDLVPMVAPNKWGYGRYGVTKYLPSALLDKNYSEKRGDMYWRYGELTKEIDTTAQKAVENVARKKDKKGNIIPVLKYAADYYKIDDFRVKELSWSLGDGLHIKNASYNLPQGVFLERTIDKLAVNLKSPTYYTNELQNSIMYFVKNTMGNGNLDAFVSALVENAIKTSPWLVSPFFTETEIRSIVKQTFKDLNLTINDDAINSVVKLLVQLFADNSIFTAAENIERIAQGHYPELCMVWLDAIGKNDFSPTRLRTIFLNCPVDIEVYNSNDTLVAAIYNDVPQTIENSSIVSLVDENGQKIIYLPEDEEYSIKTTATGDGEVNYSIQEYDLETGKTNITNYLDMQVANGDILTSVAENLLTDEGVYELQLNAQNVTPTDTIENAEKINVTVQAEGNGVVSGEGSFFKGEYAKVIAVAHTNESFDGWYINNVLVSNDSEYRFEVNTDVNLVAKFSENKCRIVFMSEDDTICITEITKGESVEVPTAPEIEGYTFNGWYSDEEYSVLFDENTSFVEDAIIYAKYTAIPVEPTPTPTPSRSGGGGGISTYTIKFETNGGNEIESVKVANNKILAEPKMPAKDGFSFVGWFTDKELTTAYNFDSKVTKGFTLYAKWEKHDDEKPVEFENPFTDVKTDDWYYEDVLYAVKNGLFNGTTESEFSPNTNLTRAMLVTVLYRAEGEPEITNEIIFNDVDKDSYYEKAVMWAEKNGIANGISKTKFAPNQNITREQIATIMHRYAQYKGYDVSVGENTNILSYDDFDSISEYAIASMQYACGSGLIKGKTTSTLNPLDNATRAEIAAILHRFIEANK